MNTWNDCVRYLSHRWAWRNTSGDVEAASTRGVSHFTAASSFPETLPPSNVHFTGFFFFLRDSFTNQYMPSRASVRINRLFLNCLLFISLPVSCFHFSFFSFWSPFFLLFFFNFFLSLFFLSFRGWVGASAWSVCVGGGGGGTVRKKTTD